MPAPPRNAKRQPKPTARQGAAEPLAFAPGADQVFDRVADVLIDLLVDEMAEDYLRSIGELPKAS